jgi:hypothetical protein
MRSVPGDEYLLDVREFRCAHLDRCNGTPTGSTEIRWRGLGQAALFDLSYEPLLDFATIKKDPVTTLGSNPRSSKRRSVALGLQCGGGTW